MIQLDVIRIMNTYDRLARLGFHRWWLPPLAFIAAATLVSVAFCTMYGVARGSAALAGLEVDPELGHALGPVGDNLLSLAAIALLTPTVLVVARLVQRRPARSLHSVTGRVRWGWLGICAGVALVFTSAILIVLVWLGDAHGTLLTAQGDPSMTIGWQRFALLGAALVILVPLQAAGEEYFCRGFLLQTFGAYSRYAGVTVSAVLFAAAHGFGTWWGFGLLVVDGVVYAALTIRTGGLETAIAGHAINNLVLFLLDARLGGFDAVIDSSAADVPMVVALIAGATNVGYAVAVLLVLKQLARRRPRLVPANRTPAPPGPDHFDDLGVMAADTSFSPTVLSHSATRSELS